MSPKKAEHRVPLPPGPVPLLAQPQLETYYNVSDWTVLKWIKAGMPVKYLKTTGMRHRTHRFDLAAVERWHAESDQLGSA